MLLLKLMQTNTKILQVNMEYQDFQQSNFFLKVIKNQFHMINQEKLKLLLILLMKKLELKEWWMVN